MGNFSLGDYGREEAIIWAWEFLTAPEWLGLDQDRIYLTVFHEDQETITICQEKLKIPSEHLFQKGLKSNFWDLGVGPCGPNLEFFYDLGEEFEPTIVKKGTALLANDEENDRYLEIWNIVFSELVKISEHTTYSSSRQQFAKKIYPSLDQKLYQWSIRPNIDTGMGLERISTILQKKKHCFDTDLFTPIITTLEQIIPNCKFVKDKLDHELNSEQISNNRKLKVIADHARSIIFMLTDLLQFGKGWDFRNKHAYVIRQILRKASLQAYFLGINVPFLFQMPEIIAKIMGNSYPNLKDEVDQKLTLCEGFGLNRLSKIIREEEKKFLDLIMHSKVTQSLSNFASDHIWTGKQIFRLVTESGLPFDFLEMIAQEKGIPLGNTEKEQYEKELFEHKIKSKTTKLKFWLQQEKLLVSTNNSPTEFIENKFEINAKVLDILSPYSRADLVKEEYLYHMSGTTLLLSKGKKAWLFLDKTPFYARKGGQEPDTGLIFSDNVRGKITNVILNEFGQHVHYVEIEQGFLKPGDEIKLRINIEKRKLTANNHSATHLLHGILRHCLGNHVQQNGSLNNDKYLRLDFFSRFSKQEIYEQLFRFEKIFLEKIKVGIKPKVEWITRDEAHRRKALDFFAVGKFYKDKVRVVQFDKLSIELCGGTHVTSTKDIINFVISDFKKIGQNIYRIYAYTHEEATRVINEQLEDFQKIVNIQSRLFDLFVDNFEVNLSFKSAQEKLQYLLTLELKKKFSLYEDWNTFPLIYFYKKEFLQNIIAKFKVFRKKHISINLDKLVDCYIVADDIVEHDSLIHSINLLKNIKKQQFANYEKSKEWIYPDSISKLLSFEDFDSWLFLRKLFDQYKDKHSFVLFWFELSKRNTILMFQINKTSDFDWSKAVASWQTDKTKFILKKNKVIGIIKDGSPRLWIKNIKEVIKYAVL